MSGNQTSVGLKAILSKFPNFFGSQPKNVLFHLCRIKRNDEMSFKGVELGQM